MSTLEQSRAPEVPVRSSRWAWAAMLASLAVYPLAIVVALGNQEDAWFPNLIATTLAILPPATGILLGVRSARSGNHLGGLATAVGSAWLTLIITFFVGANYLWSGESLVGPNALAIILAVLVAGAVEIAWNRAWKAPRHSA